MDKAQSSKTRKKTEVKIAPLTPQSIRAANQRGTALANSETAVIDARVGIVHGEPALSLTFSKGSGLTIPVKIIAELAAASPSQLRAVEVSPFRDAIRFPALDADLYVPGLIADIMGPVVWSEISRRAGKKSTAKKRAASRDNGKKGGRPTNRSKEAVLA